MRRGKPLCSLLRADGASIDLAAQRVHGITAGDLVGAPSFADVWPSIVSYINSGNDGDESVVILAHQASFDIGMVLAELRRAGTPYPSSWRWACTITLAKRRWLSTAVTAHTLEKAIEGRAKLKSRSPCRRTIMVTICAVRNGGTRIPMEVITRSATAGRTRFKYGKNQSGSSTYLETNEIALWALEFGC